MVENDPAYQEIVKPHVTVIPSRARAEELIEEYYDREFGEFDREDYNFRNPSHVGLAYTDDEETGLPKEVYADLDGCRIVTTFNGVVVDEENFKSLDEMNVALDNLSFDDLVFLTEEQRIIGIKKTFDGLKVGDTVRGDGEIWTITKITGDFSINYKNIDPAAQTTEQSVYGGWKELFAKRGFVCVSSEELEQNIAQGQIDAALSGSSEKITLISAKNALVEYAEYLEQIRSYHNHAVTEAEMFLSVEINEEVVENRTKFDQEVKYSVDLAISKIINGKLDIAEKLHEARYGRYQYRGEKFEGTSADDFKILYKEMNENSEFSNALYAEISEKLYPMYIDFINRMSKKTQNAESVSYKFTVEQTSDAFEEPFIIRNNDVSEDSPDRYYDIDGIYQTFETEREAQEYADKLNSTAEPTLERVSPVTQFSGKENNAHEVQDYRVEEIKQKSFGQKSRYAANVAAIRTLNQIESENRTATPDEQKILAQYVGWGGIPAVFDSDNTSWAAEYAELKDLLLSYLFPASTYSGIE